MLQALLQYLQCPCDSFQLALGLNPPLLLCLEALLQFGLQLLFAAGSMEVAMGALLILPTSQPPPFS